MEEERHEEVRVPTRKEKEALGLSDEQWIMMCYKVYENSKCFRELSGHQLCNLCPKKPKESNKKEKKTTWGRWLNEEEIRTLLAERKRIFRS